MPRRILISACMCIVLIASTSFKTSEPQVSIITCTATWDIINNSSSAVVTRVTWTFPTGSNTANSYDYPNLNLQPMTSYDASGWPEQLGSCSLTVRLSGQGSGRIRVVRNGVTIVCEDFDSSPSVYPITLPTITCAGYQIIVDDSPCN